MGRENEVHEGAPSKSGGFGDAVWNAFEHASGISTIKAISRTETVDHFMHGLKLLDDGRGSFDDAARQHIEKQLNGTQTKHLEEERDGFRLKLGISAIPSVFAPAVPDKPPLMKQLDDKADGLVKEAEQYVQRNMTGDEMKQYRQELSDYKRDQVASMVMTGMLAPHAPKKGNMMVEYEKRVLKAIDETGTYWEDHKTD